MTWRASPRAAVLQAPSPPARAGRWETALRCAGRVGLFPLVLSGAFYTCVGSQGGPDCACASGAPPHDLAVSPASPCKVSGARYRGSDIGTSLPTELLEYSTCCACPSWRLQAAVSPSVFFACRNWSRQRQFRGLRDARATRRPGSAACLNWQRHTRDRRMAEPRAVAATPSTVAKRDNTPLRRPRPSRRDPRLTAARGCRTSAARSANQISS